MRNETDCDHSGFDNKVALCDKKEILKWWGGWFSVLLCPAKGEGLIIAADKFEINQNKKTDTKIRDAKQNKTKTKKKMKRFLFFVFVCSSKGLLFFFGRQFIPRVRRSLYKVYPMHDYANTNSNVL